jgi:hypothetical protein
MIALKGINAHLLLAGRPNAVYILRASGLLAVIDVLHPAC